jgi:glycosyltransferase involved in cell wall biosynthesis
MVLPACNEEKGIESTIKDLKRVRGMDEVVVVCNGCTDRTPAIARAAGARVIELPEKDKCRAVLKGLAAADSDIIGFIDADGAFNSQSIEALLSSMHGKDAVIASKWVGRRFWRVQGSLGHKLESRVWNFLSKVLLGLDFSDTQAGLKIMRRDVFRKIDRNFTCKGFAFDVELLYKIKKEGGRIKEVYVPVRYTAKWKKSSFSINRTPSMFKSILRFWLHEKLHR